MKKFRNYLKPAAAAAVPDQPPVEMARKTPNYSGAGTPRYSGSRPASIYPQGDFRNSAVDDIMDIKADVMVNWLHQQQLEKMWINGGPSEGVILKKSRNEYTCAPLEMSETRDDFYDAIRALNVRVAMTMNTRVISTLIRRADMASIPLAEGLSIQVLPSMAYLATCQKHHFAAFIHDLGLLVIWNDEPKRLLEHAAGIEAQIMKMIWDDSPMYDEKANKSQNVLVTEVPLSSDDGSEEAAGMLEKPRKLMMIQAVLTSLTIIMCIAALGSGWREIAIEVAVDHSMLRVAFAAVFPFQFWLALFFMQNIVTSLSQLLGPTSQIDSNSKFYSGVRPIRIRRDILPHVTIQCPVYKEGLWSVIEPTVRSLKAAISTYEMQGGSANIFINDDGMQIISEEDRQARIDFYDENNIGWVSRPKHNLDPTNGELVFNRPGKFKKASNMNYALGVSARVEDKLAQIARPQGWNAEREREVYQTALKSVIDEDEGRTWADGNVRIGDYILLVDSDTRVPDDCLLDAVSEMEQAPQVAIIQFSAGVLNVTTSFFEKGITFFTNLIYTAITYAVANGDVAPFVGHNAMLRWSAIQDIAYDCPIDNVEKYWSEETVSEDFDMALRLQSTGYILRLATYTGAGFKEGVSLTVYDELSRWEKYAYGCNELIFHPVRYWFTRGPFTKLFRNFIRSNMPLSSKFTIMAYIGTYYAIGSAWALTLMNYILIGWYNGHLDHYYIDSFKVFFSIIIVFTALGNTALAVLRYRLNQQGLLEAFWGTFKWIPLLAIFLGGLSLHVSQALLSHMFSINMTWGATAKEADNSSFFEEIPKLLKKFKGTFAFCIGLTGAVVALAFFVPPFWRINSLIAILPLGNIILSHFLLPIALNPNLMLFTW
ncbi:hypothetical protein MMC25_004654 [Agyrium rufum]|nr:hypothetical protein [Agyrium rufum]